MNTRRPLLAIASVSRGPYKIGLADPIFAKGMSYYGLIQGGYVLSLEDFKMRILISAALAIALMTVSAHAQDMGTGRGKKHQQDTQKTEDKTKMKVDEQAYKEALKRIPIPNEKPDPWKSVR
jgi:hypothetical protein